MKLPKPPANQKVHAGHIIMAMAAYFDWFRNLMMTEFAIDGQQADMIFVSKAGYVTEIEIKVSAADWKRDERKGIWSRPRPHIARFYYAVPESLLPKAPEWLPDQAGIFAISVDEHGHCYAREVRAARRTLGAQKIPDGLKQQLVENCYHRYWRAQINSLRSRYYQQSQAARAAA